MKVIAVLCAEKVNPQEIANREDLKFLVIEKVQLLQGHEKKPAVLAGREPAQVHQSTGTVLYCVVNRFDTYMIFFVQ